MTCSRGDETIFWAFMNDSLLMLILILLINVNILLINVNTCKVKSNCTLSIRVNSIILMVRRFIKFLALLLSVGLLALTLALGWSLPTAGQILPSLSWSEEDIKGIDNSLTGRSGAEKL